MPKRRMLLLLTLVFMMLAITVPAEFSPGFSSLYSAYRSGQAYSLEIKTEVKAWPDLAEATLPAMQAWLDTSALSLTVREHAGHGEGIASLINSGRPVFTLLARPHEMRLAVGDSLNMSYTGTSESPPWERLLGIKALFPNPGEAQAAFKEVAALALPLLKPYGEPVKKSVTIKNAGRGVSQVVYQLKAEEAQALWQGASDELLPAFDRLLASLPGGYDISKALSALNFTNTFTVKRFLDAQGGDLGLQITGGMDILGEDYHLTLYGGMSGKGLYLSLKLPASRGTDTLEAQVSLAFSPGRLKSDWRFETLKEGQSLTLTGKMDLKSEMEQGGERLSGFLTFREARKGPVRRTVNYTLKPDFLYSEGALNGTLTFAQTEGKAILRDLAFSLNLQPASWPDEPAALSEMDMSLAVEEDIELAQDRIRLAFVPAIQNFLFSLPMETRLLVLHDWGRVGRTEGESVPPLPEGTETFTVTDSDDILDTKEETP